MPPTPLTPSQLRRVCDPASFNFETTADLPVSSDIIGQPRGLKAIEFGIGIDSPGYHIFVLGEEGTGRTTAIGRFLRERAAGRPTPQDWMYVNNFAEPHKPRALNLSAGLGVALRDDMAALIDYLRRNLPQAFEQESYLEARNQGRRNFEADRSRLFDEFQHKAVAAGFVLLQTPGGWMLNPARNGQPLTTEIYEALPEAERKNFEAVGRELNDDLENMLRAIRNLERAAKDAQRDLNRQVGAAVADGHLNDLKAKYAASEETILYLNEVRQDVIDHVADFLPVDDAQPESGVKPPPPDFRQYTVNLVVDHSRTQGAPVVVELNPTYGKLLGRIEQESRFGVLTTDFTLIKTGALHAANGGYLVLRARDVFYEPLAWDALKRSLLSGYVRTEDIPARAGSTKTLDPEPIPLDLKVVLVGVPWVYYHLFDTDEDFGSIFKVKADFSSRMPRTPETEGQYAGFIAARCAEEKLRPFDRGAVAKVIEYGARAADDQFKLSARFGEVTDLLREANHCAARAGRETVTATDVMAALDEKVYRSNKVEEALRNDILEGSVFIDTEGSAIGQVNALSVTDSGDYAFALPSRLTARTFVGHGGIGQIDRETNLAGPLHNKGVLTLSSFFNATYAAHRSISFSAHITFEQNYGHIEGDSASCAELYALLSSLSGHPVKQSLAVTGSVDQKGRVEPIGAVNEKIEGFFAVCVARGLTGDQGVLIPAANVRELMLNEKVVAAVEAGRFHVWPVETVDEGIEILTGVPAGVRKDGRFPDNTLHAAVQKRLRELMKGHDREHDEDRERQPPKKAVKKKRPAKKRPTRKK
ncbi:MAG: AAA family ATPase [Chloroflexi bacterium]|nr:AAA family ATPase [Chloroflexota bacterium]